MRSPPPRPAFWVPLAVLIAASGGTRIVDKISDTFDRIGVLERKVVTLEQTVETVARRQEQSHARH